MTLINRLFHQIAETEGRPIPPEVDRALEEAAQGRRSILAALLNAGVVEEKPFMERLAQYLGMPWWSEVVDTVPAELRDNLPVRLALRFQIIPVKRDEEGLWLLTSDPFDMRARHMAMRAVEGRCVWAMAPRSVITAALKQGYGVGAETFEELLEQRDSSDAHDEARQETTYLDEDDADASVIKFVNQILREALRERATDIHIEPLDSDLRIRYRIDGILHEVPVPSRIRLLQASVISRIKIMAHLDIAERRIPQDGRINLELEGNPIDVRVATVPSVTGESISLRLLGQQRFSFERLGFDDHAIESIKKLLALPNGIILLTGPTGCGKSTSLYTFLSYLNVKERRIVTIEDPVEYKLPGVIQIQVKPEINLTFAGGLRSILRSDPNIVMVGEMRDTETTEIAIRAALTGHLVFSTLHTNDAIGGITRLMDMGIEPFLIASSVRAFVAQRLVRTLCPLCKLPGDYADEYLREIGFPLEQKRRAFKAVGCEACRLTGYQGRGAIFEMAVVNSRMAESITQRTQGNALRNVAIEGGMVPLRTDGWKRVISGRTTIEEVMRVTTADATALDQTTPKATTGTVASTEALES
ncbi:MAG TPA: GspE/PulE family protein [Candidatus Methylacidiphilales bacterium]|nr:GspE/PulE family protein [Candidatus Methylacidiphilales bacterium]